MQSKLLSNVQYKKELQKIQKNTKVSKDIRPQIQIPTEKIHQD